MDSFVGDEPTDRIEIGEKKLRNISSANTTSIDERAHDYTHLLQKHSGFWDWFVSSVFGESHEHEPEEMCAHMHEDGEEQDERCTSARLDADMWHQYSKIHEPDRYMGVQNQPRSNNSLASSSFLQVSSTIKARATTGAQVMNSGGAARFRTSNYCWDIRRPLYRVTGWWFWKRYYYEFVSSAWCSNICNNRHRIVIKPPKTSKF